MILALPEDVGDEARVLGKQVLRSGTAVGANYRAVCRARSRAEFIAKIGVVVEEADETIFWLELLAETGIVKESRLSDLLGEAKELTASLQRPSALRNLGPGTLRLNPGIAP